MSNVVEVVTSPAADVYNLFFTQPGEKGGARAFRGQVVLDHCGGNWNWIGSGSGRDSRKGLAVTRNDDAFAFFTIRRSSENRRLASAAETDFLLTVS